MFVQIYDNFYNTDCFAGIYCDEINQVFNVRFKNTNGSDTITIYCNDKEQFDNIERIIRNILDVKIIKC